MQSHNNTDRAELQAYETAWIDKCTEKKIKTATAMNILSGNVSPQTLDRVQGCGNYITFLHDSNVEKTRLETGFFCGFRLCPGCAWRKAAKDATMLQCILQAAVDEGKSLFFATLTIKNVSGYELKEAVNDLGLAYTEMMRRGKFKLIDGAIRKLEITYNAEQNTYHPHVHSVWIVPKRWNEKRNQNRISVDELTEAWRSALKRKYEVNALAQDIRAVRTTRREDVLEFAKYPAKSTDYLHSRETFMRFYEALKGTRLITFLRDAKRLKREYKNGKLDAYKDRDSTEYYYRSYWAWTNGEYRLDRMEELPVPYVIGNQDIDMEVIDDG